MPLLFLWPTKAHFVTVFYTSTSKGGKLSYQRENDPIGPPRADICDLLISTVRECLKEGDTRHTFEILSPGKRPYMLQAENDEDYQDWVKALRSQTENLLVCLCCVILCMHTGSVHKYLYLSLSVHRLLAWIQRCNLPIQWSEEHIRQTLIWSS